MGQISARVDIAAPPEKVWQAISTPATYEQWLTIHTNWKDGPPERFSQGASAAEVVTMLGMPNTIIWTVDEFHEPSTMSISGSGMAGVNEKQRPAGECADRLLDLRIADGTVKSRLHYALRTLRRTLQEMGVEQ